MSPFANLPQLPPDVDEALEQFKLSIVRHRSCKWSDITLDNMATVLASLTMFCLRDAPPLPSFDEHVKAVREAGGAAWDHLNPDQELAAMRGQPQGTEARVCDDITERQAPGINKYGTSVENNPLGLKEWLQHMRSKRRWIKRSTYAALSNKSNERKRSENRWVEDLWILQ